MWGRKKNYESKSDALAGNRTRAARVAGEHSTTEPPVLMSVAAPAMDKSELVSKLETTNWADGSISRIRFERIMRQQSICVRF